MLVDRYYQKLMQLHDPSLAIPITTGFALGIALALRKPDTARLMLEEFYSLGMQPETDSSMMRSLIGDAKCETTAPTTN